MRSPIIAQFFDKWSLWTIGAIALVHGLAALALHSPWSWVLLGAVFVAAFVVTFRSVAAGLAVAVVELFVGGHGHLITADLFGFSVGIRMMIFVGVMLAWLVLAARGRIELRVVPWRDAPWALLTLAVLAGSITGLVRNGFTSAFDDMNGYLTSAYLLPILSVVWTPDAKRTLLRAFAASATWVAASTLMLVYAFTHLPVGGIHALYAFVRDSRIAEITLLSGPDWLVTTFAATPWYFRVFEQGQFSVVAMELVLIAATLFIGSPMRSARSLVAVHALMIGAIIASLSRSFWLGSAAGLAVICVLAVCERVNVREWVKTKIVGMASGVIAVLALWILVVVPVPPRPDLTNSPFYRGVEDDTRELAVSSRWNLLGPMMERIGEEPLWGSGFGTTVTFVTDDLRIRAMIPNGEWTTYRFEWGFQDIWLKMGIPGLAAFVWFLGVCLFAAWRAWSEKREHRWLTFGLVAGVVALYATHTFSPYINHPIGIGYLLFVIPFLGWHRKDIVPAAAPLVAVKPALALAVPRQVGIVTRR